MQFMTDFWVIDTNLLVLLCLYNSIEAAFLCEPTIITLFLFTDQSVAIFVWLIDFICEETRSP